MKKCPSCGRAYSDMVSVCPACKTSLSGNAAASRPAQQPQQPSYQAPRPNPQPQQPGYQAPRPNPQPQQPSYQAPRPNPQPQQPTYQPPKVQQSAPAATYYDDDKAGIVWLILSFLLPIVGIVLQFKWKHERPAAAKSVGVAACAGILLGVALTGFSNFSSPRNKTPDLTEGHYSAYTAMFTDLGISEIPASFNTESTASYGHIVEGSLIETVRIGYEGDVVLSIESILYVPISGLSAQDVEILGANLEENMAPYSIYSHVNVTYMTGNNAYAVVLRVDNLDQEAAMRDAAAAGLIDNGNADYVSIEACEKDILASGYMKK